MFTYYVVRFVCVYVKPWDEDFDQAIMFLYGDVNTQVLI